MALQDTSVESEREYRRALGKGNAPAVEVSGQVSYESGVTATGTGMSALYVQAVPGENISNETHGYCRYSGAASAGAKGGW